MVYVDKLMKYIDIILVDLLEFDYFIIDLVIDIIIYVGVCIDYFGDDEIFFDVNVRSI